MKRVTKRKSKAGKCRTPERIVLDVVRCCEVREKGRGGSGKGCKGGRSKGCR